MGWLNSSLNIIERAGNRLPDPVTLFVGLILLVMFCSCLSAVFGVSVNHPATGELISAQNLFAKDYLQLLLIDMPKTFAAFPPLGLVMLVMLGIGVADKSGLISTALKSFVSTVPSSLLTATIIFAGIMSSLAADAGYVVLIPLGAVIFMGAGRHPVAGLAAAFAGVSGGFSANLLLAPVDPLLAGFTESAAQIVEQDYTVNPAANYYFMLMMVPLLVIAGTWVNMKLIEPRLGTYKGSVKTNINSTISKLQRKALKRTGWVFIALCIAILFMVLPENALLRDDKGTLAPFLKSLVALMFFIFLILGLVYGITANSIKNDKQVVNMMSEAMSDLGHYIVLAFVAAHLVVLFKLSNLGLIIAVSSAEFLQEIGFVDIPLIVSFIIICCVINLFIGSASAKWALMAPIFVPMLMLLGYSPELTQASFRIGDSATNILTPLMPYFPLVLTFVRKYDKDFGIGTLIATMLPYSIVFCLSAILLLIIWLVSGLPLGPDSSILYIR